MEVAGIIMGLLEIVEKLMERSTQNGELSTEQRAAIFARAATIFTRFADPPPPPEGA